MWERLDFINKAEILQNNCNILSCGLLTSNFDYSDRTEGPEKPTNPSPHRNQEVDRLMFEYIAHIKKSVVLPHNPNLK